MRRMAVSVLNYLRIHRVDQAEKQVRAMSFHNGDIYSLNPDNSNFEPRHNAVT